MNPEVPREYCVYFVYGRADYPIAAGGLAAGGLAAGVSVAAAGSMDAGGGTNSAPAIVEINLVDEGAAMPGSSTDGAPGASGASSAGPAMEGEVASPDSAATSVRNEAPWRRRHTVKKPPPAT